MPISDYETITVASDRVTVDLLVWRRYKRYAPGIYEKTLDVNPHLAPYHKVSPFLPPGVQVFMPIDPDIMAGKGPDMPTVTLFGPRA